MTIDNSIVTAILAAINGGIVTAVVQALKKWLGITGGWKATALAAALSIGGTVYVLIHMGGVTVVGLVLYSAVAFGSSTGLFHLTAGVPTTPAK